MNTNLNPKFLDNVLSFVEVGSTAVKRAVDEVTIHRQAQKRAADLRASLLAHMVASGVVPEIQKQAADSMLGSHAETMQLLKAAVDKIVELRREVTTKTAKDLGSPDTRGNGPAGTGGYNSLTSPHVGQKTAELKESDLPLLRAAGMSPR